MFIPAELKAIWLSIKAFKNIILLGIAVLGMAGLYIKGRSDGAAKSELELTQYKANQLEKSFKVKEQINELKLKLAEERSKLSELDAKRAAEHQAEINRLQKESLASKQELKKFLSDKKYKDCQMNNDVYEAINRKIK